MLGTNRQRREVEALEKIARASTRMANAVGRIAEHEKEKAGFLKWFLGLFGASEATQNAASRRRYRGDGGLRSPADLPPVLPNTPNGGRALTHGERPCINITDSVPQRARR